MYAGATEFPGLKAQLDAHVAAHPNLFCVHDSWEAAKAACSQAGQLWRVRLQARQQPASEPTPSEWVPAYTGGGDGLRLRQFAKTFKVPLQGTGKNLMTTRKGFQVLESIQAMKDGFFRDLDIWKELKRRHGWDPK